MRGMETVLPAPPAPPPCDRARRSLPPVERADAEVAVADRAHEPAVDLQGDHPLPRDPGIGVGPVDRLHAVELEAENSRLKRMYADLSLTHHALQDAVEKKL